MYVHYIHNREIKLHIKCTGMYCLFVKTTVFVYTLVFCSIIVDKIDKDKDGKVTEDELKSYIDHTQKRYIYEDVDRQWLELNPENTEAVSWEGYVNRTYGFDVGK